MGLGGLFNFLIKNILNLPLVTISITQQDTKITN